MPESAITKSIHFIFDDALAKSLPSFREGQLVQRTLSEIEVRVVAARPVTANEEARARKALATSDPLETLGELRARYQALPEADTRKRDLIVPLDLKRVHHPVLFPEETKVTP